MLAGVSRSHEKLLFFYIRKNETKEERFALNLLSIHLFTVELFKS